MHIFINILIISFSRVQLEWVSEAWSRREEVVVAVERHSDEAQVYVVVLVECHALEDLSVDKQSFLFFYSVDLNYCIL